MKIAVSGKGGVGKTTISANLVKLFHNKGCNVFAIDADPDSSLGLALGITPTDLAQIKPVVEMSEIIEAATGDGALFTLNPAVDTMIDQFSFQFNGIRFLRMGGVKPGGSDCYCHENSFLNSLVNALVLDTKDIVILDMGAGIEHLTRGTASGVDMMIVVTEPGLSSVTTARIVQKLAQDIGIKDIRFIANKIHNAKEQQFIASHFSDAELLGMVSYDDKIAERAMECGTDSLMVDNGELEQLLNHVVSEIK